MGLFSRKNVEKTTVVGRIDRIGNVQVNSRYLGIVVYYVNNVPYEVRMPLGLTKEMERKYKEEGFHVQRVSLNLTSFQVTNLIGKNVVVEYDVNNPKKAKVIREYV